LANQPTLSDTLRQTIKVLSRQRKIVGLVFAAVMVGAVLAGLFMSNEYEADMKILVLNDRAQPSVSAGTNSVAQPPEISDEELNSEVELLKSRDILEDVVLSCDLENQNQPSVRARVAKWLGWSSATATKEESLAQALIALQRNLTVQVMKKTDLIDVTYTSKYPDLSVKVLKALAGFYLKKHLEVHQIPGALAFFTHETQHYQNELARDTNRLSDFTKQYGIGSASDERDKTLAKLVDFEASMRQAQADVHDKRQRIAMLQAELQATPGRIQTQVRVLDNAALLGQMQSSLLEKELKRTELAATFNANYAPLRELNAEIAQVRSAIASQKRTPVSEQTSDTSPTHTYLMQDLAVARADLASQRAQAAALAVVVRDYRNRISGLEQRTIQQQGLDQDVKTDEENYLLYRSKFEESRISDALDQKNIANVSIAEAPEQPARPSNLGMKLIGAIGFVIATLVSIGSAFLLDSLAVTFRTSEEVEQLLGVPVLGLVQDVAGDRIESWRPA
jgi:uncharacterized protein involved in exopolysaccharide biosynthesis